MKGYILSIVGVVLISAIVAIVAPSGKMGNFIKGAVKLVGVFILVAPFVSLFSGENILFPDSAKVSLDESYLEKSASLMAISDGREIEAYLGEKYCVTARAEVIREIPTFSLKSIAVKITDFGIIAENEHIDIVSRVKSDLEDHYHCAAEVT